TAVAVIRNTWGLESAPDPVFCGGGRHRARIECTGWDEVQRRIPGRRPFGSKAGRLCRDGGGLRRRARLRLDRLVVFRVRAATLCRLECTDRSGSTTSGRAPRDMALNGTVGRF